MNVEDLADQHLFAEWREIKMVPAALRRSLKTRQPQDILNGIPKRYTLNAGHVTFFFDKARWLEYRYNQLTQELLNRGYNIAEHDTYEIFYEGLPAEFTTKNWAPDEAEISINVERILLRISEKPNWYRMCGSLVSYEYFHALYRMETV